MTPEELRAKMGGLSSHKLEEVKEKEEVKEESFDLGKESSRPQHSLELRSLANQLHDDLTAAELGRIKTQLLSLADKLGD